MTSDLELSTLHTRSTLIQRLKDSDHSQSWDEFYRMYRRLVFGFSKRSGLSHEEAEEVTQDVFARVSETIKDFDTAFPNRSFRGWLMQLARWRVTDKFRVRAKLLPDLKREPSDGGTSTIDRVPDQNEDEEVWESEWRTQILDEAMNRLATRCNPKHFQLFDLHLRQAWSTMRIAREFGLNPARVYLITHRLAKVLKKEVASLKETYG